MSDNKRIIDEILVEVEAAKHFGVSDEIATAVAVRKIKEKTGVDLSEYFPQAMHINLKAKEFVPELVTEEEAKALHEGPEDPVGLPLTPSALAYKEGDEPPQPDFLEVAALYVTIEKLSEYTKIPVPDLNQKLKHLGLHEWKDGTWSRTKKGSEYVQMNSEAVFNGAVCHYMWHLSKVCALLGCPVE